MVKKKNLIKLYRFYNLNVGKYGEPFGLCDKHFKTYKIPDNVVMTCIASNTVYPCEFCENPEDLDK